jgi:hypothetical protein
VGSTGLESVTPGLSSRLGNSTHLDEKSQMARDPVRVGKIAGHANVSVTLNVYAEEFDKAMHRDDLMRASKKRPFGSL